MSREVLRGWSRSREVNARSCGVGRGPAMSGEVPQSQASAGDILQAPVSSGEILCGRAICPTRLGEVL